MRFTYSSVIIKTSSGLHKTDVWQKGLMYDATEIRWGTAIGLIYLIFLLYVRETQLNSRASLNIEEIHIILKIIFE